MSQLLINDYLKQLDLIKKTSGSSRETTVRAAFKDLLKAGVGNSTAWCFCRISTQDRHQNQKPRALHFTQTQQQKCQL
jgi:hypothetical protein